jgi:hypothetical protein
MILNDDHIEAIRAAASTVQFGSVKITAGTDNHIDIIVENRIRLPKETDKNKSRPPLLAKHGKARQSANP